MVGRPARARADLHRRAGLDHFRGFRGIIKRPSTAEARITTAEDGVEIRPEWRVRRAVRAGARTSPLIAEDLGQLPGKEIRKVCRRVKITSGVAECSQEKTAGSSGALIAIMERRCCVCIQLVDRHYILAFRFEDGCAVIVTIPSPRSKRFIDNDAVQFTEPTGHQDPNLRIRSDWLENNSTRHNTQTSVNTSSATLMIENACYSTGFTCNPHQGVTVIASDGTKRTMIFHHVPSQ